MCGVLRYANNRRKLLPYTIHSRLESRGTTRAEDPRSEVQPPHGLPVVQLNAIFRSVALEPTVRAFGNLPKLTRDKAAVRAFFRNLYKRAAHSFGPPPTTTHHPPHHTHTHTPAGRQYQDWVCSFLIECLPIASI